MGHPRRRARADFGLRALAFAAAAVASALLARQAIERPDSGPSLLALLLLLLAPLIWLLAERRAAAPVRAATAIAHRPVAPKTGPAAGRGAWRRRAVALASGALLSFIAYQNSDNNLITPLGQLAWLASLAVWLYALSAPGDGPRQWLSAAWNRWPRQLEPLQLVSRLLGESYAGWRWRQLALLAALALVFFFRLHQLAAAPPIAELEHILELQQSVAIGRGETYIYDPHLGGREPLFTYFHYGLTRLGLPLSFATVKLASALAGALCLLPLYWLGRELLPGDERAGRWLGIAMLALAGMSSWHSTISRLGIRTILGSGVSALFLLFLLRALRMGRRRDWLFAGLTLGLGLYTYQAVRFLPLAASLCALSGLLANARRRRWRRAGRLLLNFALLAALAFLAFLPLFHYMNEQPEIFWERAVVLTGGDRGESPPAGQFIGEFIEQLDTLSANLGRTLAMFHGSGGRDPWWHAPGAPALDPISAAFLALGLAAWLARLRWRGHAGARFALLYGLLALLPMVFILQEIDLDVPGLNRGMLLLPVVFAIAALPLVQLGQSFGRLFIGRGGRWLTALLALALFALAIPVNYHRVFALWPAAYAQRYARVDRDFGDVLREFVDGGGRPGNGIVVNQAFYLDHRYIALAYGDIFWEQQFLSGAPLRRELRRLYERAENHVSYRLDPDAELLFLLHPEERRTRAALYVHFRVVSDELRQGGRPDWVYRVMRVAAPGEQAFRAWLAAGEG